MVRFSAQVLPDGARRPRVSIQINEIAGCGSVDSQSATGPKHGKKSECFATPATMAANSSADASTARDTPSHQGRPTRGE